MNTEFEQQIDDLRTHLNNEKIKMYQKGNIQLPDLSELRRKKKIVRKKENELDKEYNNDKMNEEITNTQEEDKLTFQEAVELIKKKEQEPPKEYVLWKKLSKEDKKEKIETFLKKENIFTVDLFQQIADEIDAGRLNTQKDITWDKENERVIALGRIVYDAMKDVYYLKSNQPKKSDHAVIRKLKKNSYRK